MCASIAEPSPPPCPQGPVRGPSVGLGILVAALSGVVPGCTGEGSGAPATITVATWNVHRFFDPVCDSGRCDPGDFEQSPTASGVAARARRLAEAIDSLGPDLVVLQEIENRAALEVLAGSFERPFETAELAETGGDGTLDVAILARAPLTSSARHQTTLTRPDGSTTRFSRALLEVRVSVGGVPLVLLGAHFRSKRDDDPGRRLAEAAETGRIARRIAAEEPGAVVLVGGDLNDVPGSAPLLALEEEGALVRLARELQAERAATYVLDGEPFALDHLYVTSRAEALFVPGSAEVHETAGERGFAGSDHRALTARLALPAR